MKKDQAVQSPAGRLRARRKKRIMIALAAAVVILAAVVIGVCAVSYTHLTLPTNREV